MKLNFKLILLLFYFILMPSVSMADVLVSIEDGLRIETIAPTPSLSAAVGGGSVPAGTFFYVMTLRTATGETNPGGETAVTLEITGSVNISWPVDGTAVGYRIWRSPVSGIYGINTFLGEFTGTTHTDTVGTISSTTIPPVTSTVPAVFDASNTNVIFNRGATLKSIQTTGD